VSCPPPASVLPDIQLLPDYTFTLGRRPKIKAAPKVKGKKGKIAVNIHGRIFTDSYIACQAKKYH
jgi:hypothetical protein